MPGSATMEEQIADSTNQYRSPSGPNKGVNYRRLCEALKFSQNKLKPFREHRIHALKQYVGRHYSNDGATDRVPVNMIEQAVLIYLFQLAAQNPRVLAMTRHQSLKPAASGLEDALNHLLDEINFLDSLQRAVVDSLFAPFGILKVGMAPNGKIETDGFTHDVGQPFADCVDFDDYVRDMSAKRYDQVGLVGHQFRMLLDHARENPNFKKSIRQELKAQGGDYGEPGEGEGADRISRGTSKEAESLHEYIDLWELWLPVENVLVTFPVGHSGAGEPLEVREWTGPECGPYHHLSYHEVPANEMPLPPVANWIDLHDAANRSYNKLMRQAARQKTVLAAPGDASADAAKIRDAVDGGIIVTDAAERVKEFAFGGVDNVHLAFFLQTKQLASMQAGNLDSLGGLAPQSETATQEKLLAESASARMRYMQRRVMAFTQDAVRSLAFYLWYDPLIKMPLSKRIKGSDIEVPYDWDEDRKEGDFLEYNISIEPYSMAGTSPAQKLSTIQAVFSQLIAPFAAQMQQQGIVPDFEGLLRMIAKYTDMDELDDILKFTDPSTFIAQSNGPVQTGKPANTTRTYDRVKKTGTPGGQEQAMSQLLMAAKPQQNGQGAPQTGGR